MADSASEPAAAAQPPIEKEEQYESSSQDEAKAVEAGDGDGAAMTKAESKASANNMAAIPNGGTLAWMQVAGAWVLLFNTWGLLNTFGVYQEYYESGQLFTASSSDISWIGSIQSFLLLFVGAITGPVYDAGHLRLLLLLGSFGVVFGHMMLSLVHVYWQALLAQAFVIGIGAGCLFVPSVAVLSTYFSTRLSTAIGVSVSGSSLGGVIYPIMFQKLVAEVGFPWAVRIIGFMALGMLVVPCTVMRMRVKPPAKRALFDTSAWKEPPYLAFICGGLIGYAGLLIVFFYLPYYTLATGIADASLSDYILPISNAASCFGRLLPSIIADRTGPINMLIPAALVTGILPFTIISVHNLGGAIVLAIFYGFWSGAYISLPPAILVHLTPPTKRHLIGTRMGMAFTVLGLGVLMGTPVAGAILGNNNYFAGMWIWAGSLLLGSCAMFAVLRTLKVGFKLMVKV